MKTRESEKVNNESIEGNAGELTDLSVTEEQAEETKGGVLIGMLLPAIQKVR